MGRSLTLVKRIKEGRREEEEEEEEEKMHENAHEVLPIKLSSTRRSHASAMNRYPRLRTMKRQRVA